MDIKKFVCVFDFETTGIPRRSKTHKNGYYPPEELTAYDTSRAVSLAWVLYDGFNKIYKKSNFIIIPDNFVSSPGALKVHGITDEYAKHNGVEIQNVLNEFYYDLKECNTLVAYNVYFDYNILLSECYRYNNRELSKLVTQMNKNRDVKCAMKMSSDHLKNDPNFKPRSKYMPSLQDSYRYLFNKPEFNTSHDALDDTIRCGDIYYEIRKRIIQKEMDDYEKIRVNGRL
jgi:DNA polymerase III epsilon subunit-like protein